MRWKRFLAGLCLFLLCFCFCFASQHVLQQQTLTELSSSISNRLTDLKKNSVIVTEQLNQLSKTLESSQAEAAAWKTQSTQLSSSLVSINGELTECYQTITIYKTKLEHKTKVVVILLVLLIIRFIGLFIGYYLYAKGIKLPRWLDLLL